MRWLRGKAYPQNSLYYRGFDPSLRGVGTRQRRFHQRPPATLLPLLLGTSGPKHRPCSRSRADGRHSAAREPSRRRQYCRDRFWFDVALHCRGAQLDSANPGDRAHPQHAPLLRFTRRSSTRLVLSLAGCKNRGPALEQRNLVDRHRATARRRSHRASVLWH